MRELTVTEKDCAQQLIKYLSKYMEEAPKSFFYKMLRKKNIVLNQKKADGSEKLKTGDTIRMYLAEERRTLQSSGPEHQRSDSCRKNRCGDAAAFRTDRRAGCWKILSDGCKRNRDRDRADTRISHKK